MPIERSLSRKEMREVAGTLAGVLEHMYLHKIMYKTSKTDRFDTIENH